MEINKMFDFVPDTQRIAEVFSQALAPTFFLGAVAAFISLMTARLSAVVDRIKSLNAIPDGDNERAHLKADLERLMRRARFLNSGILACLRAGLCSTLLLAIMFTCGFFGLKHGLWRCLAFRGCHLLSRLCAGSFRPRGEHRSS
jgi:hypothetical protein